MSSPETDTNENTDEALDEVALEDLDLATEEATEEEKEPLTLEVSVEKKGACQRHVTVSVSHDDVERYFTQQFDELMPDAQVPGFRKGHAPRKLVERRFRKDIADQVKGQLLMDSITQVNEEQDFSAISEPDFDFDSVELPDDGPMTFEFDLEVRPEFDLPEWRGLEIEKPVRSFSDEDVESHMKKLLARYGDLVPHDGAAEKDDYLTLNMRFRHNGDVVSELEETTVQIRLNLSFADGTLSDFDKLAIGSGAGDTKQAKITLTADAPNKELRSQEVDCELEILDVKRLELPTMDQKFLDRIGGFENEDQVREAVKGELERQLNYHRNRRVREQITSMLTESADWDLPPDLLDRQSHRELERAVMELQSAGFSNAEIKTHENQLRQNSRAATATALKEHFILERIAEEEKIEDAPQDYDREIAMIAMQQGDSPRRVRARLEKRGQMDTLRNQIIERKVIELITSHAKFKEVPFEPEEQTTEAVDHFIGGEPDVEIPAAKAEAQEEELRQPVDHS